jgi:hypothetical protein
MLTNRNQQMTKILVSTKERKPLTVEEAIALLKKCPQQAMLFFRNYDENITEKELEELKGYKIGYSDEYTGAICSVELRVYASDNEAEVWLHDSEPNWEEIGVTVIEEEEVFAKTISDDTK